MDNFPDSMAAKAIEDIALNFGNTPARTNSNGSLTFFMNKVFQAVN